MRVKLSSMVLAILFIICLPVLVLGQDIDKFQYTSDIDIRDNKDNFIVLEIAPRVYAKMDPSLKDLRIYNKDKALKHLILPLVDNKNKLIERNLDIYNAGTIGHTYSFEIKIPKDMQIKDIQYSVKLDSPKYLVEAKIYGSNDRKEWKHLKNQTIYGIDGKYNRFTLDNIQYDYIKVEYGFANSMDLAEVNSVTYSLVEPNDSEGTFKVLDFTRKENKDKKTTIVTDGQFNNYPTKQILLISDEKYFHRQVEISGSNDKESWEQIKRTFIFRDDTAEKLAIKYLPKKYRYVRINIYNEDNQPLKIENIKTEVIPVHILVDISNTDTSTIKAYWGDRTLTAPKYDIAKLNISFESEDYRIYELDKYEKNKDFVGIAKQLPLTERYPWLMLASLSVLIIGVLIFLYKTIRTVE